MSVTESSSRSISTTSGALAAAAQRLGVAFDPDALHRLLEQHPSSNSLRALVEVAPRIGIEARAFRSDVSGLAAATLPAIVHLIDTREDESGFGILLEAGDDRFVIDVGPAAEPRVLSTADFESSWSGIVVTLRVLEAGAAAAKLRRGGAALRLKTWYRRGDPIQRVALLGRYVAAGAGALLALGSAWLFGSNSFALAGGVAASAVVLLAGVGLAASVSLFFQSRRSLVPVGTSRLSASICGRGKLADCLGVLASRYSRFAGIDWGSVGVAFFSANLSLAALGALLPQEARAALYAWLAFAYLLALPGSLVLTAVQIYPLRRFCPMCMAVHVAVGISSTLGILYLLSVEVLPAPSELALAGLTHGLFFSGAFGLAVPYLLLGAESRASRARLGWIGSTPLGALAEAAGRPAAVDEVPAAPVRLGDATAPFRLEALVHPMCSGCGPVAKKLVDLERRHGGRVTIGFHFPPRDVASPGDWEMCTALAALGSVLGGTGAVSTFLRVKDDPWPLLRAAAGGAGGVLPRLLPQGASGDGAEAALSRGRAAVEAADDLARKLERGTPTLLVNNRFWDGSVEDLEMLLARQPDLLAAALGVALHESAGA